MTHTYENLEDRAFMLDDIMLVPDGGLLAAMIADEHVSDLWENPPADTADLDMLELHSRHIWEWERCSDAARRSINATIWGIALEGYAS